jgi:hypothetical protein
MYYVLSTVIGLLCFIETLFISIFTYNIDLKKIYILNYMSEAKSATTAIIIAGV